MREEIAARIAAREIMEAPELAARRPLLEAAVGDVVAGDRFAAEFHAGASALHRSLFDDTRREAQLILPGAGGELRAALASRSASAARAIPEGDPSLMQIGGGRLETALRDAAPIGARLASLAPLSLIAAALLLGAAALRAPTRRRGLRRAALGIAVAAGATVAATAIARAIVLSTFDTSHGDAVVGTIWSAFLGDLRLWALVIGAVGLIAAAVFEPGAPGAARRGLRRMLSPTGSPARLVRAGALALLAAMLLWMPEVPLDLALVTGAGVLVFTAVAEVVRISSAR